VDLTGQYHSGGGFANWLGINCFDFYDGYGFGGFGGFAHGLVLMIMVVGQMAGVGGGLPLW
jgi:hypothetical protein